MIQEAIIVQNLISEYIEDTNLSYTTTEYLPEINVGDVFEVNEEKHEVKHYGNVNDILNSNDFKKWLEKKGYNNG